MFTLLINALIGLAYLNSGIQHIIKIKGTKEGFSCIIFICIIITRIVVPRQYATSA